MMKKKAQEFLWVEKYRPTKIDDCILPKELKQRFKDFVKNGIPNLLLSGGPGVGKTTVARAMLEEAGIDYMLINGSLHGNIDTLRNDIKQYASSVSFDGKRKYVILDEADYLNAQSTQPALRGFMEEFSHNCGFILTCNFRNRIIPPLHSRCSVIEFGAKPADRPALATAFMVRVCSILDKESVQYDKKVIAALITKHFLDWRRIIGELQRYSSSGVIDTGLLTNIEEKGFKDLVTALKKKDFKATRKWVGQNLDNDNQALFRKLYDSASEVMEPGSIPQLVLTLADYQYKAAFAADQEINLVACLTEVMVECKFK